MTKFQNSCNSTKRRGKYIIIVDVSVGVEILQLVYMEETWSYLASSCLNPLVNIFGSTHKHEDTSITDELFPPLCISDNVSRKSMPNFVSLQFSIQFKYAEVPFYSGFGCRGGNWDDPGLKFQTLWLLVAGISRTLI